MEVTVSDQIIQVLDALCDKFGLAIDWGAQNVLPYAQELMGKMVSYELWTSLVWVGFELLYIAFYGFVSFRLFKIYDELYKDDKELCAILFWTIGGFMAFICFVGFFIDLESVITCLTFPEKIVFEMMQSMMK